MKSPVVLGSGLTIALIAAIAVQGRDLAPYYALIETGTCTECDLQDANLRGVDLSYTNLSGSNLQRAKLYREGPVPASLEGANLAESNLYLADLRLSNLRGTDFKGANLSFANLSGSDLRGANLQEADLRGANLDRTILFVYGAPLQVDESESTVSKPSPETDSAISNVLSISLEANGEAKALDVQFEGAMFDLNTLFPEGFDPLEAGMEFMP
ncbi:MAG: pentapeptide repeat-containing protein [Synechococcus sp.]